MPSIQVENQYVHNTRKRASLKRSHGVGKGVQSSHKEHIKVNRTDIDKQVQPPKTNLKTTARGKVLLKKNTPTRNTTSPKPTANATPTNIEKDLRTCLGCPHLSPGSGSVCFVGLCSKCVFFGKDLSPRCVTRLCFLLSRVVDFLGGKPLNYCLRVASTNRNARLDS